MLITLRDSWKQAESPTERGGNLKWFFCADFVDIQLQNGELYF